MTTKTGQGQKVRPKHYRKNLLFHIWPTNTLYIRLETQRPVGLTLDLYAGTWSFGGHTFPIGKTADYGLHMREGIPYGVYDRTKVGHLRRLIEVHENLAHRMGGGSDAD
ncbi:hypothetical protein KKI17_02670 [Patescibacteria group bacterium]|nr:hypothetical protein [Patescibacteria group bacterium]